MKLKFFLSSLLIICSLFLPISVKATADSRKSVRYELINPGNILYPLKRGVEKVRVHLSFSNISKARYQQSLLNKRFTELKYVAEKRKLHYFETTSNRFSSQISLLRNQLVLVNQSDQPEIAKRQLESYLPKLDKLRDLYPANSSHWLFIQQNIDTVNDVLISL